jgi:acyl carrier protein
VQDGKITPKGLAELKARMPYADLAKFEQDPDFEGLRDLFTVDLISRYIRSKLAPGNN